MDYLPTPPKIEHKFNPISFYCSGRDKIKTLARHPYISPLWGSLEGLPPLLIQCGEKERLRDECILFTYKARGSFTAYDDLPVPPKSLEGRGLNPNVELDMYPGMVHVFQAIPFLPESNLALKRMLEFMQRKETGKEEADATADVSVSTATVVVVCATKALQTDQERPMMERLVDMMVESTVCKSMEEIPLHLQLIADDARLEGLEGEAVTTMYIL
ncbi:hypothetical protein BGZ54_004166 [Gamsiella multidivaricata]|nr:hypothetical protein BGZ54_004166 [Gamsiella multidivaricata]